MKIKKKCLFLFALFPLFEKLFGCSFRDLIGALEEVHSSAEAYLQTWADGGSDVIEGGLKVSFFLDNQKNLICNSSRPDGLFLFNKMYGSLESNVVGSFAEWCNLLSYAQQDKDNGFEVTPEQARLLLPFIEFLLKDKVLLNLVSGMTTTPTDWTWVDKRPSQSFQLQGTFCVDPNDSKIFQIWLKASSMRDSRTFQKIRECVLGT
jgi:hypothetical protein